MKIRTVTITGIDNNNTNVIDMNAFAEINSRYPFVEWGILFSPKRTGEPRYPSMDVVKFFTDMKLHVPNAELKLSAHLCGGYTRKLLVGEVDPFLEDVLFKLPFDRFQLNFNSKRESWNDGFFDFLKTFRHQFILQRNTNNDRLLFRYNQIKDSALLKPKKVSFLQDFSGGAGKEETAWLPVIDGEYCGYAGGLNPDNIEKNLDKLAEVVGDNEIWIDMESGVRTNEKLDFEKVRKVLEVVKRSGYLTK